MISWSCGYELIGKPISQQGECGVSWWLERQEENRALNIPVKRHTPNDLNPSIPTLKVFVYYLLRASSKALRFNMRFIP